MQYIMGKLQYIKTPIQSNLAKIVKAIIWWAFDAAGGV